MGCKTLKEAFNIEHIVHVQDGKVCIGSSMVSELVSINPETGKIESSWTFKRLKDQYPALFAATQAELVALIEQTDIFKVSIPVFTYQGADIIEKACEEPGWPNVTHDGELMYENTFSNDKDEVIAWAKKSASIRLRMTKEDIERAERDLALLKARLVDDEAIVKRLENPV